MAAHDPFEDVCTDHSPTDCEDDWSVFDQGGDPEQPSKFNPSDFISSLDAATARRAGNPLADTTSGPADSHGSECGDAITLLSDYDGSQGNAQRAAREIVAPRSRAHPRLATTGIDGIHSSDSEDSLHEVQYLHQEDVGHTADSGGGALWQPWAAAQCCVGCTRRTWRLLSFSFAFIMGLLGWLMHLLFAAVRSRQLESVHEGGTTAGELTFEPHVRLEEQDAPMVIDRTRCLAPEQPRDSSQQAHFRTTAFSGTSDGVGTGTRTVARSSRSALPHVGESSVIAGGGGVGPGGEGAAPAVGSSWRSTRWEGEWRAEDALEEEPELEF